VKDKEEPGGAVKIVGALMMLLLASGCATGGRGTLRELQSIPDHQLMLCQEVGTKKVCAIVNKSGHLERELIAFTRGYRDYG